MSIITCAQVVLLASVDQDELHFLQVFPVTDTFLVNKHRLVDGNSDPDCITERLQNDRVAPATLLRHVAEKEGYEYSHDPDVCNHNTVVMSRLSTRYSHAVSIE